MTAAAARVREARMEDAGTLAVLATQLGYPSSAGEIAARLQRIASEKDHVVLVAEGENGKPCGFADVASAIALQSGPRAELVGLVIEEAARGHGIGRLLVAEAEQWAAAHGFAKLCVRCNVVRTRTHRFYEGLGFECSKTQKYFLKPLAAARQSRAT